MRHSLLFLLPLFFTCIQAQTDYNRQLNEMSIEVDRSKFGEAEAHIEGGRYLEKEFQEGEVLLADSSFYADVKLRYDAYEDALETLYKEQIYRIPSQEKMIYAILGEDTLMSLEYLSGNKQNWANLFLLHQGELSLYAKKSKSFKKAEEPQGYADAKPAKYVKSSDVYYWAQGNNLAVKVGNKKEVEKFLGKEAITFMKKEKLSLRKEEDLIEIVIYYNSNMTDKGNF